MKVGLNLYSICNFLDTEERFLNAANKLKDMGYEFMQLSGSALPFDAVKRVSEKSALPIVLTHSPLERIINDTDALMKDHELLNCRYIGLGAMPGKIIADKEKCLETIDALEKAASYMEERGYKFFYHNHNYEFLKYDGKTVLDIILERAPHVHFTLDTYWVQYGGGDVVSVVEKLKGKIECVHLKDYNTIVEEKEDKLIYKPQFAPVGDGVLDFGKIIDAMKKSGVEYFLVEQDNAAKLPNTMELVERSVRYIHKNF
ncbi:MAG: sugar phosphate isomerase/epimerase [Ruminococcaceae bacterium]|nr:sugar phosphate isomerase/epimerase [Oscillospiraceae bacterium]